MPSPNGSPRRRFHQQHSSATNRGIEWRLTFEEWWAIWQDSGKWDLRGREKGNYVMARKGDVGPYSKDNVFICPLESNVRQAWDAGRTPVPPSKLGKGRGWYFNPALKKPYVVQARCKRIGNFATQAEAEEAYRAACATTTA